MNLNSSKRVTSEKSKWIPRSNFTVWCLCSTSHFSFVFPQDFIRSKIILKFVDDNCLKQSNTKSKLIVKKASQVNLHSHIARLTKCLRIRGVDSWYWPMEWKIYNSKACMSLKRPVVDPIIIIWIIILWSVRKLWHRPTKNKKKIEIKLLTNSQQKNSSELIAPIPYSILLHFNGKIQHDFNFWWIKWMPQHSTTAIPNKLWINVTKSVKSEAIFMTKQVKFGKLNNGLETIWTLYLKVVIIIRHFLFRSRVSSL